MIPKLRFPEFVDEWKSSTIGREGSFYYGKSAPKWSVTEDAKTECVRYGELYSKYSGIIDKIHSKTNIDVKNLKLSKGGEVLVPRVGEDPLDFAECSYLPFKNVAIGEMISVYNTENDGFFMSSYFRATCKYKFARVVEGGNVSNLYFRYLEPIEVFIPNKVEQRKISSLIKVFDKKINLLTKKKEALETYKKGLMQKIFSQELRFKREDGTDYPEWDYQPLGDLAYITSGKSNREDSDTEAKYHFFDRSSDVRRSGIYLYDDDAVIVAGEGQEFIPKKFSGKFDLHQRAYAIMKFGERLSYEYCYYFIFHHRRYFERMAVGTTVLSLRLPMFQKMMIQLPSMEEQDKIVAVFTNIDSYLKNVSNGIQSTESLKKGLLQQMFV